MLRNRIAVVQQYGVSLLRNLGRTAGIDCRGGQFAPESDNGWTPEGSASAGMPCNYRSQSSFTSLSNHRNCGVSLLRCMHIRVYNSQRPHASLDFRTPEKAHSDNGEIKKRWKHYPRKSASTGKETEKIF